VRPRQRFLLAMWKVKVIYRENYDGETMGWRGECLAESCDLPRSSARKQQKQSCRSKRSWKAGNGVVRSPAGAPLQRCHDMYLSVGQPEKPAQIPNFGAVRLHAFQASPTSVVLPAPCTPFRPTKKGGGFSPLSSYCRRCCLMRSMMKGTQCSDLSSMISGILSKYQTKTTLGIAVMFRAWSWSCAFKSAQTFPCRGRPTEDSASSTSMSSLNPHTPISHAHTTTSRQRPRYRSSQELPVISSR